MLFNLALIYVFVIFCVVFIMFWFASTSNKPISVEYGRNTFIIFFYAIITMICTISSGLGARLISLERREVNFDLLKITLLKARQILFGKILSLITYIIILILLSFPLMIIIMPISRISFIDITRCYLILLISAITFSFIGLMWSSFFKNVRNSMVLTYITSGIFTIGTILIPLVLDKIFKIKLPQMTLRIVNLLSPFIATYRSFIDTKALFFLPEWLIMILIYLIVLLLSLSISLIKIRSILR